MSLDVEDLITELTADQVKATLYSIATSLGLNVTAWQKLSPVRTIFAVVAQLFAGFTKTLATVNKSAFLDFAVGPWLSLLAYYVYGVTRRAATFAKGQVTVTNAGGGLYTYGPGDLQVLNSVTNKVYANVDTITISPLSTLMFDVQALEQGSASTATPGQITNFVAASPSLSVTNGSAIIGDDEETDPDLRVRCRLSMGALSPNGPKSAQDFVARSPDFNGGVAVTRTRVLPAQGNGTIRVVVASESGPVTGTAGDITTDLGKVADAINRWATPSGYTSLTASASTVTISQIIDVWIPAAAGLTNEQVQTDVEAKLTEYFRTMPIGGVVGSGGSGKVPWRAFVGQVEAANDYITEASLSNENDIAIGPSQVPVLGSITVNVHQVAA